jgi:putative GTP pyrophosphokinase
MTTELDDILEKAERVFKSANVFFEDILAEDLAGIHIQKRGRIKSKKSINIKVEKKRAEGLCGFGHGDLNDIVGFRLVCHFPNEVEKILEAILERLHTTGSKDPYRITKAKVYLTTAPGHIFFKDRLAALFKKYQRELQIDQKKSRYTSVHLIICNDNGNKKFEVQIRNVFEDAWAEIEHALKYKATDGRLSGTVDRHLKILNTFIQACSEYSEGILQDVHGESNLPGPKVKMLNDDGKELSSLPKDARLAFDKATVMRNAKNFNSAVEILNEFIDTHEKFADNEVVAYYILMERGVNYLCLNRFQEAISDYKVVETFAPGRALVYFRLADAYRLTGNFEEVIKLLEIVSQKVDSPENTTQERDLVLHYPLMLAHAYWKIKKPQKSVETLQDAYKRKILVTETADKELKFTNSLAYYHLESAKIAGIPLPEKDLAEFKGKLESLNVKGGNNWNALDTYAVLCDQLGLYEEAYTCALQVEGMIHYPEDGEGPVVKIPNGEIILIPLEDIEIVRAHVDRIKRNRQAHLSEPHTAGPA